MNDPNISKIVEYIEGFDMGDFFGGVELKIEHGKVVLAKLIQTHTRRTLLGKGPEETNVKRRG